MFKLRFLGDNMPVQSSSVLTVTLPSITLKNLLDSNSGLKIEDETHKQENRVKGLALEILKDEKIELKRELESEKIEKKRLTQLADEGLQSSKRVLQCVCAIAGALLSGGLVLAFPPTAAIAFTGTGPAAAGMALAGGATGGCIIAPFVHKKTNNAIIQQIQTLKIKEEVSEKTNINQNSN